MENSDTPLELATAPLIIGSCISYDFAHAFFKESCAFSYIWRVSTPSLMTGAPSLGPKFSISGFSEDEKRIFQHDYFKTFDFESKIDGSDVVVIDFFRDSYDFILTDNGTYITRGPEYWSHNLLDQINGQLIRAGTFEHSSTWLAYADIFCLAFNARRPAKTIILNAPGVGWLHGAARSVNSDKFDIQEIRRKNYILSAMCNYISAKIDNSVLLEYSPWTSAAELSHDWGAGPVHLTKRSVDAAIDYVPTAIAESRLLNQQSDVAKVLRATRLQLARSQLSNVEQFI